MDTNYKIYEENPDAETAEFVIKNKKCSIALSIQFLSEIPPIVKSRDERGSAIFYIFNGKHYEHLTDERLKEMFHLFVMKYGVYECWRSNMVNEVLSSIRSYKKVREVKMNGNEDLLVVNNGVLNIRQRILIPHSPDYFLDSMINVDYTPLGLDVWPSPIWEEVCPNFMRFLSEVMSHDTENMENIIRLGGYLLDSSCKANKVFLFNGRGASGKSTLLEVFLMFFAPEHISSLSLEDLSKNTFDCEVLLNSRINVASEQKRTYVDAEQLKQLTEGAIITIKRKYLPSITIRPKAKIVYACNGLPHFNDTSDGIYRRLQIFEFKNQYKPEAEYNEIIDPEKKRIYKQDPELLSKIKEEKSAILNLFLWGLERLRAEKYSFIYTKDWKGLYEEYKIESDSIAEFLYETYEVSPESHYPLLLSLQEYRNWYEVNVQKNSRVKLRSNELGRRIREVFGVEPCDERVMMTGDDGKQTLTRAFPIIKKPTLTTEIPF